MTILGRVIAAILAFTGLGRLAIFILDWIGRGFDLIQIQELVGKLPAPLAFPYELLLLALGPIGAAYLIWDFLGRPQLLNFGSVGSGDLPLLITLSGFHFSNYAGLVPEGAKVVSVTMPGGQSTVSTDESIDDQVFALTANITNLSEKRTILSMRLVLTRADGQQVRIDAGRRGQWGLLMGEHDVGSVSLKGKNIRVPAFFDFPLTIEPHSNVDGRVSFIPHFPRDLLLRDWMFKVTETVEIADALSDKSVEMPTSGTYRGS